MTNMIRQLKPQSKNLASDAIAGFTNAVVNVPDSIAAAILAGVNPTYAFNAVMVGTPVGALFTSSEFMSLGPTSPLMLTVGTALAAYSGDTACDSHGYIDHPGWPFHAHHGAAQTGFDHTFHL